MAPSPVPLPQRLRNLRTALGITQRELAAMFQVSHAAVGLWESGRRPISGPTAVLLASYEEEVGLAQRKAARPLKTDRLSRTLKSGQTGLGLLGGMGLEMVLEAISRTGTRGKIGRTVQDAVARQITESLGDLKGLMMKVGQMASYMDFLVPDETRENLQSLQDTSTPMSADDAAGVVFDALGQPPARLFSEWEPYPRSAASIGQVHRAVLKTGEVVAVKVQYPGIRKALLADFENAGVFDQVARLMFHGQERGVVLSEIRDRTLEECDYRLEGARQTKFRENFRADTRIVVPRVFHELTTETLLVTEWIEGRRFRDFAAGASQEEKDRAGQTIFDFVLQSVFKHHEFNGDPHPGNFLFPEGRVAFLDFGCVKVLPAEFVSTWGSFVRANLLGDPDRARSLLPRMGLVTDLDRYDWDYHREMIEVLYRPGMTDEPFTFTKEFVAETWRALLPENANRSVLGLSKNWVFFNQRVQWGLFGLLATLGATARWREHYLKATEGCVPPPDSGS